MKAHPHATLSLLTALSVLSAITTAASIVLDGGDAAAQTPALPRSCAIVPGCPEAALEPGARVPFRKTRSAAIAALGSPHHRARDVFVPEGAPQWLFAKFAYGKLHKDLEGEDVDIWVLRRCSGTWEKLATVATSENESPIPVDDAPIGSGRVAFAVPKDRALSVGLHRIRYVVRGDGSSTDALAEVIAPTTRFFVSDIDGTLTVAENVELGSLFQGVVSGAHRDAPKVLSTLAEKGYRPLYLSARAEALTQRTHEFLAYRGFPLGAVRLTTTGTGVTGEAAATFKSKEMRKLASQNLVPSFGFGNRPSDTVAYEAAGIVPANRRFFLGLDDPKGGRRFDSYTDLLPDITALPALVPPCP